MYSNTTGMPSVTEILRPYINTDWFKPEHAERGTAVHAACTAHLQGLFIPPLPDEWRPYFESFKRWSDLAVGDVISTEQRLVDSDLGFCGRYDLICTLKGSPERVLVDIKTAQAYQPWWALQLAAYRYLVEYNAGKHDGSDKLVPQRMMSVRTKADGSGCLVDEPPKPYGYYWSVFCGALATFRYFG